MKVMGLLKFYYTIRMVETPAIGDSSGDIALMDRLTCDWGRASRARAM
jgi:hypothetical protein